MNSIRILVADDHPIVRDGLVAVLETQPDFEIVGEASDGYEVLTQVEDRSPDVILLDLEMPNLDGVATLVRLKEQASVANVIVFTAFDTDDKIVEAVRAGAKGYLLKGAPRDELFNAIRIVYAGGTLLQPVIASRLMDRLNAPPDEQLTTRESEVLTLVAGGRSNRAIAEQLIVTERTVKFHVSAILAKLDASNRTEAVAIARERGYIDK